MKKIFSLLMIVAAMLSLTSCVTSLQPLVTHDKIITDNRVIGNWLHDGDAFKIESLPVSELTKQIQQISNKNEKPFAFTGDAYKDSILFRNLYAITFKKNDVTYYMAAGLMRIGNEVFMDLYPAVMNDTKAGDLSDPFSFNNNYMPGFTIAKVELSANNMTLKFVDGAFIHDQIKAGRMKLKHENNDLFETFMITASTAELRSFLQKYAKDERIFNKKTTVILTKQPFHS